MLDPSILPVFLLAVLALAVVPGPDLALIVSHALARGVRAGVWCSVGIALAGFLQTTLVALGLGHLMQRMPAIEDAVRWVGAAYLLWIGIGLLVKARHTGAAASEAQRGITRETPYGWLGRGLLNNLLNPKALLFFSLFLPQFATAPAEAVPLQFALLGVILTVIVMVVNVGVAVGSRFPTASREPERRIQPCGRYRSRPCVCRPSASVGLPGSSRPVTPTLTRVDEMSGLASLMDRRRFLLASAGLLAVPRVAEAQTGKVWRIGFASLLTREEVVPWFRELEMGLRELGYIPDQNLQWEVRYAAGHPERLQRLMAEIVASRVDAILAPINANVIAAKQATSSIPIVMVNALDPVGNGLVASLARPGGNVTGSTFEVAPQMYAKNVELLASVLPQRVPRLGILWNPTHPGVLPNLRACMDAAPRLGVSLQPFEARTPDDLSRAIAAMRSSNAVGFILLNEPMYLVQRATITAAATAHRLSAIYPLNLYTEAGGLMSYGPNLFKLWRDAAKYFDKIFKGTRPEDIPLNYLRHSNLSST